MKRLEASREAQQSQPERDPLIYPGLYAPSGFDIMDILVGLHSVGITLLLYQLLSFSCNSSCAMSLPNPQALSFVSISSSL